MSKFIDYIENREEFLTNKILLEFFDEKVEVMKDRKVYLPITKMMFNYSDNRETVYIEDVIKYKNHKADKTLCVVDKNTKIIFINTDELMFSVKGVSYSVLQPLLDNNKLVKSMGDYKVVTIKDANEEFFNEIKLLEKTLNIMNKKLLLEKGEKFLESLNTDIESEKNNMLIEMRNNYILDKDLFSKVETNFITCSYSEKFYDILYRIKDHSLDKLILEYFRDKSAIMDMAKESYYNSIEKENSNVQNYLKVIFRDNLRKEVFEENKEIFKTDLDILRKKEILNTLKLAGKSVMINGKKYKNDVRVDYKSEIQIGDNYGNEYININNVEKIEFRGKTLYSA